MSERNIHFKRFAELLVREMGSNNWMDSYYPDDWNILEFPENPEHPYGVYEEAMVLVAQRAYDLVSHILQHAGTSDLGHACSELEAHEAIQSIPDVEWPELEEPKDDE